MGKVGGYTVNFQMCGGGVRAGPHRTHWSSRAWFWQVVTAGISLRMLIGWGEV